MILRKSFGVFGYEKITLFILKGDGIEVGVTDFGAAVQYIEVDGKLLTLGYADIKSRIRSGTYCGVSIGRVANRIKNATYSLNGRQVYIDENEGKNCLHGGYLGFDKHRFEAKIMGEMLKLSYLSPDGECGFEGNLEVVVTFSIVGKGLKVEYEGESDKDAVFAPTLHTYFNLNGGGTIDGHILSINSKRYLENDAENIPANICGVEGTKYNFSIAKTIGDVALDNNYCLSGEGEAVRLKGDVSGITLTVSTNMLGVQIYTGDYITGGFACRSGVAIEPQFYPNAINDERFVSPILRKGERARYYIQYNFN